LDAGGNAQGVVIEPVNDWVGIGISAPTASLDVNGTFRYTDGSEADGRVLTSDASGNATWKDLSGQLTTSSFTANDNDAVITSCTANAPVTYTGPTALLDVTTTTVNIPVSGLVGNICKVTVTVNLTHTYDGDLTLAIISPSSTSVILSDQNGTSGDNYQITTFDDANSTPIASGTAPFNGTFAPDFPLSALNGETPNGTWVFSSTDNAAGDVGTLNSVVLNIYTDQGVVYTFIGETSVVVAAGETTVLNATYSDKSSTGNDISIRATRDAVSGSGSVGTVVGYSQSSPAGVNRYSNATILDSETGLTAGTYYYKLWAYSNPVAGTVNSSVIVTKHK
jgi:subtilisin-like proprotein convertase family protein